MRRALPAALFVVVALVLAVVTTLSWTESGQGDLTVGSVLDGDTIRLTDGRRVRLAQVDAPELSDGECYAREAQGSLASMVPVGSTISLERDARSGLVGLWRTCLGTRLDTSRGVQTGRGLG